MELKLEQVIDAESLFTEMVAFSPTSLTAERKQKYQSHQSLKCPRCDSCNTKFCYYNNYRLTQPRHFCKSCKRYWTNGGTLRNLPVGGGCRKNKKSKQINTGQKRKGVIENTCKRIADRGSVAKTSCNLSATHAPAFSNNKCSSSSNIDLSHTVTTSCWIPGYLRFPSDREEITKLPSDGITKSSYDSPKFQNSQVESSINSVITLTSTGEEERARIVFTGENSFRNLLTSDVRYVRSDHQENSISNSLILSSPDFSNYPLLTGYSPPDSALLDATFSTSQWLDQIATHNNENADPSQIYGALAHSMPSSSQPQKIVDPIIEMGLMNCFKVWPQWRMQNDEYQQISPEEGKPNTVHADQLVEVSESEALYKCMVDASAERLSKIEGGKLSFLDNTVWDWQLDPEGLIWASELCYMGGLRVRPELPQFDV